MIVALIEQPSFGVLALGIELCVLDLLPCIKHQAFSFHLGKRVKREEQCVDFHCAALQCSECLP